MYIVCTNQSVNFVCTLQKHPCRLRSTVAKKNWKELGSVQRQWALPKFTAQLNHNDYNTYRLTSVGFLQQTLPYGVSQRGVWVSFELPSLYSGEYSVSFARNGLFLSYCDSTSASIFKADLIQTQNTVQNYTNQFQFLETSFGADRAHR